MEKLKSFDDLFADFQDHEDENQTFSFTEETTGSDVDEKLGKWKILIVDDEEDIHSVTWMALKEFTYKGKDIQFIDTYSAEESKKILRANPDIAIILLDVVMESNHAGLELVKYIREEMKNPFTQIILRTGHPGQAPEREVIISYQINDYKTKTELTSLKLFTTVFAGIRAYEFVTELEEYKQFLEQKVAERTAELKSKNKAIIESIEYARRIQSAILPSSDYIDQLLPENFIYYQPRDIVSGDFYWLYQQDDRIYVTVADCTGHGVPGAFMSILGITILEEILNLNSDLNPNEILDHLRKRLVISLKQTGEINETQDGMDMILCIIEPGRNQIKFAGAYNSLYKISNGELQEYKGDKIPVGITFGKENNFSCQEIEYSKGDMLYLYTDGYFDQFGGPSGKKYSSRRFKELLMHIHNVDLGEQKEILQTNIENWMAEMDQIDDITVMGIRL